MLETCRPRQAAVARAMAGYCTNRLDCREANGGLVLSDTIGSYAVESEVYDVDINQGGYSFTVTKSTFTTTVYYYNIYSRDCPCKYCMQYSGEDIGH